MARLPGIQDLGRTPGADWSTGVPDYAGGAAVVGQGGKALAAGLAQFGEGVGELGLDQSRWEFAKARSYFLSGLLNQNETTGQDTNYGPDASGKSLVDRHAEAVSKLQTDAAGLISSGPMRERFVMTTAEQAQRSNIAAFNHARGLENNANIAWVDGQGTDLMNKAVTSGNPDTRRQIIDSQGQLVDGLVTKGAITPVQALAMKQGWARQYATADLLHRSDTDPQGVINDLRAAPGSGDEITNRILQVEGSGPNARSSANGAGQFIDSTWGAMLRKYRPDIAQGKSDAELAPLKADSSLGRQMTDAYRQENVGYLQKQGLDATPGAQYLAHFLGPAGAAAVLKADPGMPVADALAKAVGPKTAQAMIAANPSVLQGQLAGSVTQWASGKMGGVGPGGGSIYDILRPDVREQLLAHAQAALDKKTVTDRAAFEAQVQNATSEAFATGAVSKPLTQSDFVLHYGADAGAQRYQAYDVSVQTGRAVNAMATMSTGDRAAVVNGLAPQPGDPNYALKEKAYGVAQKAAANIDKEIADDPAAYAIRRLPASKEAYATLQTALTNPTADDGDRTAAAQRFAAVTLAEQAKVGVPADARRVVTKDYAERFNTMLSNPKAAGGSLNVASAIEREAARWGNYWPDVAREVSKNARPVVSVIASGIKPGAAQILADYAATPTAEILKNQDVTKASAIHTAVVDAFKPFAATLPADGGGRIFSDFRSQAERLAAYYVTHDNMDATKAATQAYGDLVGDKYDFSGGTYRVPKDAGVTGAEVAAGVAAAKSRVADFDLAPLRSRSGLPDEYAARESSSAYARDGVWITDPRERGLVLTYAGNPVKRRDGTPFVLSWEQLAQLGRQSVGRTRREFLARHGVETYSGGAR